jgi:hypothetical protein
MPERSELVEPVAFGDGLCSRRTYFCPCVTRRANHDAITNAEGATKGTLVSSEVDMQSTRLPDTFLDQVYFPEGGLAGQCQPVQNREQACAH